MDRFAANTPWNWDAEKSFTKLTAENPDVAHHVHRASISVSGHKDVEAVAAYRVHSKTDKHSPGSMDEKAA